MRNIQAIGTRKIYRANPKTSGDKHCRSVAVIISSCGSAEIAPSLWSAHNPGEILIDVYDAFDCVVVENRRCNSFKDRISHHFVHLHLQFIRHPFV